jgi:formate dehydrogenase subunit delta
MDNKTTVRMANQIADFFGGYGHDSAVTEIADHINRFWEPRMRMALLSYLAKGGEGLNPLVKDAAHLYRRPKAFVPTARDTKPGPTDATAGDFAKEAVGHEASEDH